MEHLKISIGNAFCKVFTGVSLLFIHLNKIICDSWGSDKSSLLRDLGPLPQTCTIEWVNECRAAWFTLPEIPLLAVKIEPCSHDPGRIVSTQGCTSTS